MGVYVDELLKENGIRAKELDAVAVSMGPGSYTGLRIGVSLAKGICFGTGKPLIAISTLKALAISVARNVDEEALFCPMIDARRMEVYSAIFNRNGEMIRDVRAEIIDPSSFSDWLVDHKIYFFGNGSGKVKEVIVHPHARFVDRVVTSAVNMITLAEQKWEEKTFEDLAYFEPFYLKDFIAIRSQEKSALNVFSISRIFYREQTCHDAKMVMAVEK